MFRYFSMFSGIGGFELGIRKSVGDMPLPPEAERGQAKPEEEQERWRVGTPDADGRSCVLSGQPQHDGDTSGGFACVGHSEIDKYAEAIYQYNIGGKNYGDATKIDTGSLPDFDVLVGGFPCQAFSIAGKRRGFEDTRGTLFFEIARIAEAKRPRLLVLENVKGLLNHDGGNTFYTILKTLDELGYDAEWQVLNSKHFGVPQNRERVFIIGHLRGEPWREVFPIGNPNENNIQQDEKLSMQSSNTLRTNYSTGYSNETYVLDYPDGRRQPKVAIPVLTPDRPEKRQNGRRFKEDGEESFTLTGQDKHGVVVYPTLTTELAHSTGRDFFRNGGQKMLELGQIRRLTPIECERLQGFPDGWTAKGIMSGKTIDISDTQRYKCLGNAVTTNVITAVFRRILEVGLLG